MDISIVINIHREGNYVARSLRSLYDQVIFAQNKGLRCELVIILDDPDEETSQVVKGHDFGYLDRWTSITTMNRSLAESRNEGCAAATGEYITLLDGDDLWSYNSLVEKYKLASSHDRTVAIPQYVLGFGGRTFVNRHERTNPLALIDHHPYVSQIFASATLFRQQSFKTPDIKKGRRFEDWHFNMEAIAKGWNFSAAPDTLLFYRQRGGSIMGQIRGEQQIFFPHETDFFHPRTYLQACPSPAASSDLRPDRTDPPASLSPESFWHNPKVLAALHTATQIEPTINLQTLSTYRPNSSYNVRTTAGELYYRICERALEFTSEPFTDVFLLPDLSTGGGEKYLLQVAQALQGSGGARAIFIGTDSKARHTWRDRLGTIPFIPLSELGNFDEAAAHLCIFRFLESSAPGARIHVKPSEFGHSFIENFSRLMPEHRFVYYRWCDVSYEFLGIRYNSPFTIRLLDEHGKGMHRIVCDCERIRDDDAALQKLPLKNYTILPAHVDEPGGPLAYSGKTAFTGRMMWASRLDSQKRPELVNLISQALKEKGLDLLIDVFAATHEGLRAKSLFATSSNIKVRPPFSRFSEVETSQYDALLYTSWYDGMPNVVLEAMSYGLPIIAPDVGGIRESVGAHQGGIMVPHHPDDLTMANKYAEAILAFYESFEAARTMSRNGAEHIKRDRNIKTHQKNIMKIFEIKEQK